MFKNNYVIFNYFICYKINNCETFENHKLLIKLFKKCYPVVETWISFIKKKSILYILHQGMFNYVQIMFSNSVYIEIIIEAEYDSVISNISTKILHSNLYIHCCNYFI